MKNVIIMSSQYTIALGVARSLGEAGYGVSVLALNKDTALITGKSKYVQQVRQVGAVFEEIWRALEALRRTDERVLVIPLQDNTCMILNNHEEQLQEHFIIPSIKGRPGEVAWFMDKSVQKKAANQCGLLTASGQSYTTDEKGIQCAISEVTYPCFQKPLSSIIGEKSKLCFAKCSRREELQDAMRKARAYKCGSVLIEQFLPIDKELTAYGVSADNNVFIPACMEAVRSHRGVAAEGIIRSAKCLGETKEKLEEYVRNSGITGLFCIDLIQSEGQLYFSEMNLRGGGSGYGVTLAGANLPGTLADMVYNHSSEGPNDVLRDVHFLNERIELKAYMDGSITRAEYNAHMTGRQERFIKNKDDPRPWRKYYRHIAVARMIMKQLRLR